MGQKFQFYVQIKTGDSKNDILIARHLQWCYSYYAIDRAHNLINYIENNFSRFFEGNEKDIIDGITAAIEYNPECFSWQKSCDLVTEQKDFFGKSGGLWFKIDPFSQDNNDGIFVAVIDVKNEKISYAFDLLENDEYVPIAATEYLSHYLEEYMEDYKEEADTASYNEEMSNFQVTFPAANEISQYSLLTKGNLAEIFGKAYRYKICLKNSYDNFVEFAKKTAIKLTYEAKHILDNRYFNLADEIGKKLAKSGMNVSYIPTPKEVAGLRKGAVTYIDIAAETAETVLIKKKPTHSRGVDFITSEGIIISKSDFSEYGTSWCVTLIHY